MRVCKIRNEEERKVVMKIVKICKLYLIVEQCGPDGKVIDYKEVYKILWELQRQVREIKNRSIQLCWEYHNFSSDYNKEHGEYPHEIDILQYKTLGGFVYDRVKGGNDLYSGNASTASRDACAAFKNAKVDIMRGDKSIVSYKKDQPIDLHNRAISVVYENGKYYVDLKLLNKKGKEKFGIPGDFRFELVLRDRSSKTIVERCIDGVYGISASKLIYDRKKRMWRLNLAYSFEADKNTALEPDKVLGIDMGIVSPICASVNGDYNRFTIGGGEIEAFRRKTEARRRSLLRQGPISGSGRIGHGRTKRIEPATRISDKVARFRDTANHKYSRALIDYAVKNGCGRIQMEDLTGIAADKDKFLRNWPYYDLQMKIENKAKENGITVTYVKPGYTSQRCSKCGYIDRDNRPAQATFKCQKCGFEANADYNASQNIAIKDIDKIISAELKQS